MAMSPFMHADRIKVGKCNLTVSRPVLKAPKRLHRLSYNMMNRLQTLLSSSTCATT